MLNHLELINFRNYEKYLLNFSKITILVGKNGIGKTNIIEAIWLLSSGRSWRTNHDIEAINWEKDFAKISGKFEKAGKEKSLELILQKESIGLTKPIKVLKINGTKKRLIEILGQMPAVLFSPETIQMIDGPPQLRRRFLDILLSFIEKKYALCLLDYAKILRSRNKLLFFIKIGKSKIDELDFWDEKIVFLGKFIIAKRKEALKQFNQNLSAIYQNISGKTEDLKICYKQSVEEEHFQDSLIANQEREIEQTATLYGPHRDDLQIILNGKDITTFGSRGEYRSAVLALKVAELQYLEKEKGEKPLLLLDDIFSELDKKRRMHLGKIVFGQQTIITTTDLDHIEKELREKAKIIEL